MSQFPGRTALSSFLAGFRAAQDGCSGPWTAGPEPLTQLCKAKEAGSAGGSSRHLPTVCWLTNCGSAGECDGVLAACRLPIRLSLTSSVGPRPAVFSAQGMFGPEFLPLPLPRASPPTWPHICQRIGQFPQFLLGEEPRVSAVVPASDL